MKTIQQYFRDADIDELVNDYIFSYPITIKPSNNTKSIRPIAEVYQSYEQGIRGLIENIRTVEITPDDDETWVFFVHHCVEREDGNVCVTLAKLSDIKDENKFTESYAYEFSPIAVTAGYYVADTYLTQRHIRMVLMDYLFESSFFGFEQEDLDDALSELEERIEETKDVVDNPEKYITLEELGERVGWTPEKRDPEEKAAWNKLLDAEIEYNKVASKIEERKVLESLPCQRLFERFCEIVKDGNPSGYGMKLTAEEIEIALRTEGGQG